MKNYIIVILISAFLISTLFFALPKTETIQPFDEGRFDLNKKEDSYWKNEYILELNLEHRDKALKDKYINQTRDILYKRLKKAEVEEIQIVKHNIETEDDDLNVNEYLKITIQTTIEEDAVQRLISSTGNIAIMTPKEDWVPDEENILDAYMIENYEPTKWTREEFRNILINDLRAGDGEKSYFGIFKPKIGNRGEFKKFLQQNQGQTVGILMDSFVIPMQVQAEDTSVFAVGLGADKGEAYLQNIILNTGELPVTKTAIFSTKSIEPTIYKVDHVQVILAILVGTLSLLVFLYQREKDDKEKILQLAFSLLLIFSTSITILKIWQVPTDLFLLIPIGILTTIFLKTMYTCTNESRIVLIMTITTAIVMATLGTGYISILGKSLLFVILLSFVTETITKLYFKNIKEIHGNI